MKTYQLILLISIIATQTVYASNSNKKSDSPTAVIDTIKIEAQTPFTPNVTVYTPKTIIYDDAVDIVRYEGYTLINAKNSIVFKVDEMIDVPRQLELKAGEYTLKLNDRDTPVYSISVSADRYNEFIIE